MAKVVDSIIKFSGRVGNEVHVNSARYKHHVRKAPAPGLRKNEWALKLQQGRNKKLNALASSIKVVIADSYCLLFKKDMYQRILKLIKKEPSDSRSFSLLRLKGMEINVDYPLSYHGQCKARLTTKKGEILVNLEVISHPLAQKVKANCYYNDLLLFTWDKTNAAATVTRKFSDWIYMEDGKPEFEFCFPKPAGTIHWLLALRQRLGVNGNDDETDTVKAEGAQFIDTGSFNKKEQALLDMRFKEIQKEKLVTGRSIPALKITERVKAKRIIG